MPLFLALLACAPHPAPLAEVPIAAQPATVSPPVTLDEFRAAFPVGTEIRLGIAGKDQAALEQRWRWIAVDETGCTIAATVHDLSGALVQDEGASRAEWAELMGHAAFPAERTTREDSHVKVPAGEFDTWLFTVTGFSDAGAAQVKRYHFAKSKPGPPMLFTIEERGEEVFRMTMLKR